MALFVFLSHAAILTGSIPNLGIFFILGAVAVDVFMFISGFLMLWNYEEREAKEPWDKPSTWRQFWVRRFLRIAPLYWAALALVYLLHEPLTAWHLKIGEMYPPPWGAGSSDPRIDDTLNVPSVLAHYSFAFGLIPKWASSNQLPDWSIGLEMQFYLCFPFLALAVRKLKWAMAALAITAIWRISVHQISIGLNAPGGAWGWYPMPTLLPLRLGIFLCGMLAAARLRRVDKTAIVAPACLCALSLALWHSKHLALFVFAFLGWEIVLRLWNRADLIGWMLKLGVGFLSLRVVKFVADCSYGLYLLHSPIQLGSIWLLSRSNLLTEMEPAIRFAALILVSLPASLFAAWSCHRWIELPGIRLGKALAAR